jgi:hypothetical protein
MQIIKHLETKIPSHLQYANLQLPASPIENNFNIKNKNKKFPLLSQSLPMFYP